MSAMPGGDAPQGKAVSGEYTLMSEVSHLAVKSLRGWSLESRRSKISFNLLTMTGIRTDSSPHRMLTHVNEWKEMKDV